MVDKLRSNSSFRAFGVYDCGHEHSEVLEVCTSQYLANLRRDRAEAKGSTKVGHTGFEVHPTTLLVHDGAHALRDAMYRWPATVVYTYDGKAAGLAYKGEKRAIGHDRLVPRPQHMSHSQWTILASDICRALNAANEAGTL